jgi:hypothetical protein
VQEEGVLALSACHSALPLSAPPRRRERRGERVSCDLTVSIPHSWSMAEKQQWEALLAGRKQACLGGGQRTWLQGLPPPHAVFASCRPSRALRPARQLAHSTRHSTQTRACS